MDDEECPMCDEGFLNHNKGQGDEPDYITCDYCSYEVEVE